MSSCGILLHPKHRLTDVEKHITQQKMGEIVLKSLGRVPDSKFQFNAEIGSMSREWLNDRAIALSSDFVEWTKVHQIVECSDSLLLLYRPNSEGWYSADVVRLILRAEKQGKKVHYIYRTGADGRATLAT